MCIWLEIDVEDCGSSERREGDGKAQQNKSGAGSARMPADECLKFIDERARLEEVNNDSQVCAACHDDCQAQAEVKRLRQALISVREMVITILGDGPD